MKRKRKWICCKKSKINSCTPCTHPLSHTLTHTPRQLDTFYWKSTRMKIIRTNPIHTDKCLFNIRNAKVPFIIIKLKGLCYWRCYLEK